MIFLIIQGAKIMDLEVFDEISDRIYLAVRQTNRIDRIFLKIYKLCDYFVP
jgi:hypothetical protein